MDFEAAKKLRDARLRRGILSALHNARGYALGGCSGQMLVDVVGSSAAGDDQGFESGDHLIRLVRDLKLRELVTEEISGLRRGQRLQPGHLFVRITGKGSDLIEENIPPIAGIDDERVEVD